MPYNHVNQHIHCVVSSPELKAQESFFDQSFSIVCRGHRCCHHKLFAFSSTGQISTKLGTKHPWMKGIQIYSNEGPHHFPRGDNYEIAKYIDKFKKSSSSAEPLDQFHQTWHKSSLDDLFK